MKHLEDRRRILVWLGAAGLAPLALTPALAQALLPTPPMTEGPFYPRMFPQDTDADLTRIAGRSGTAQGSVLDVSGRIVDRSGRPLAHAKLELWQCDHLGQYHHVGEPDSAGDVNFQGFGVAATDAEGRYRFRTIKPVPYPGRTPHIHFNVVEGGKRRLTSQMFVEGEPGNARDFLYRGLGADAKRVTLKLSDAPAASGAKLAGALEIVVA
jgi:protocatechuate 3,4-dioxygenase beta subunit